MGININNWMLMILVLNLLGLKAVVKGILSENKGSLANENGFFGLIYEDGCTPRKIYKPSGWYSSYMMPDSNYASEVSTISIYFSLNDNQLDISDYYAEITTSDTINFFQCLLLRVKSEDWKAMCDISNLKTPGVYGPILLIIRSFKNSQIIAIDLAFGYFVLLGDKPDDGNLEVSFYSDEENPVYVVQEDVILQFDLTIDVKMYSGDYFLLGVDDKFYFDDLAIEWVGDVDGNSFFYETMNQIYIDDEKNVFIYGFSKELTIMAAITFRLIGFKAPAIVTSGSSYLFSLDVQRFGANTVNKRYLGTGPSDNIVAGYITIVSWEPTNSDISKITDLCEGLTTWFRLIVLSEHDIPKDATIVFVFTGNEINAKSYQSNNNQEIQSAGTVGIYTYTSSLSCLDNSATQVTCTASSLISAGTFIVLVNLITISETLTLTSVATMTEISIIDENTMGISIGLPESGIYTLNTLYARIATSLNDATGVYSIMSNSADYGILVGFKVPELYSAAADIFTIYLPFTTGTGPDNTKLVIADLASVKKCISSNEIVYDSDSNLSTADVSDQVLGSNSITVPLIDSGTIPMDNYFYAFIGSKHLGATKIYLPKIPTQVSQMAEIILKLKIGSNYYIYVSPLYFADATLALRPLLRLACRNTVVAGIPASLSFTLDAYVPPSGYTLMIVLNIDNVDLFDSTNLNEDDLYPGTDDFKVTSRGSLYKSNISYFLAIEQILIIPLPLSIHGIELRLHVSAYLVAGSGDNILIYSGSSPSFTTTSITGTHILSLPDDITLNVGESYNLDIIASVGYTNYNDNDLETIDVFYILVFPYGYSTNDSDLDEILYLGNTFFPYSYAYKTIPNYVEGTGLGNTITITVTVPWYKSTTTITLLAGQGSLSSSFNNIDCDIDTSYITTESPGDLTFIDYSPETANSKTYFNEKINVTLTLVSEREIFKGTTFSATLDYWTGCVIDYIIGGITETTTTKANPSGTSIIVRLTNCDLPIISNGEDAITVNGFTSVTGYYNENEYLHWDEPDVKTQTVIPSNIKISEKATNADVWVFPSMLGVVDAYFGISFTLDPEIPFIPAGSTIEILGGFDDEPYISYNLWCSFEYISASISSGLLIITNANEINSGSTLKIIKDHAFDLTTMTPDSVLVTITYNDEDIIKDLSTTQKYTVYPPSAETIILSVKVSDTSAGFLSLHNFSLTFTSASEVENYWVHLDATGYNAMPGPVFQFEDLPDIYFLHAFDSEGDIILCITNHWITSCGFEGPMKENSVLDFSIWIYNGPKVGLWSIFVTDDKLNYLYQPAYTYEYLVFPNHIGNDIDLYFAQPDFSSYKDHYFHDLKLSALINIEATAGSEFIVYFPSPYEFTEFSSNSILCSLIYHILDEDNQVVEVQILKNAKCALKGYMAVFTLIEDQTFTSDFWTDFYLKDVLTPELIYSNSEENCQNKICYSQNFRLFYSTKADGIVSASFDNLNGAFVSFTQSNLEPLVVNEGNRLFVIPGTWSGPYMISNEQGNFNSESVIIYWESDSDFIELDERLYVLDYKQKVAYFWIGIPLNTNIAEGIYTIEWKIFETPFEGFEDYYSRPKKTLVQVIRKNALKVVLNPQDIYVPRKGWSMPIKVQFETSEGMLIKSLPYNSIMIEFEENDDLELYFRPNPLVLDLESPERFFSIQCTKCFEQDKELLVFSISVKGIDRDVFMIEKTTYSFISGSRYNKTSILTTEITNVLASEFNLSLSSDQIGIATWCVISESMKNINPFKPSLEYMSYNSFILGADLNRKDDLNTLRIKHETKIKELDEIYSDYQILTKKKLNLSRSIYFSAQTMILSPGKTQLSHLTGLAPKTIYHVFVYFDNFDGNDLVLSTHNITTARTPSHASLTFKFTNNLPDIDTLKSTLKKIFELPEANYNLDNLKLKRGLAESKTAIIYSDTCSSNSAYEIAIDSMEEINNLLNNQVTISEISDDEAEVKIENYEWNVDNETFATLNYSSSVDGSAICVIERNGKFLISEEIFEGVNSEGKELYQYTETISAGQNSLNINFAIESNFSYGIYHLSCIVCNEFPGIPDCSDEKAETDFEYTETDKKNSGSEAISILFAIYLLA